MSAGYALTLLNSSLIGTGATSTVATWPGGRAALVLSATQFGSNVFLQTQSIAGTWISINATTYSANQVTSYDLPAGQYRMTSAGSSIAVAATLVRVVY